MLGLSQVILGSGCGCRNQKDSSKPNNVLVVWGHTCQLSSVLIVQGSMNFNSLASYYGIYHVCHLPIFCIVSFKHLCMYLKQLSISVSIHWNIYCDYILL